MSDHENLEKAKTFKSEGLDVLKTASMKIAGSVFKWAFMGGLTGFVVFLVLKFAGGLNIAWGPWAVIVWLLLPIYAIVGALTFGKIGLFRGFGRVMLNVGVERGYVAYLTETLVDKVLSALRKNKKNDTALDAGQTLAENVPLASVEDALKDSTSQAIAEDDGVIAASTLRGKLMKKMRDALFRKIEAATLSSLRAETQEEGVSMSRVREVITEGAEGMFEELVTGKMDDARNLGLLIAGGSFAIVPLIALFV